MNDSVTLSLIAMGVGVIIIQNSFLFWIIGKIAKHFKVEL